jgi:hypothetical protein
MKNFKGHRFEWNPYRAMAVFFVCMLLIFSMCMTILQIDQPSVVNAGEAFEITMQVEVSKDDDSGNPFFLVVGFLAPRSWSTATNTSVRFESSVGNSSMRLTTNDEIDENTKLPWNTAFLRRFGIGDNYGEVEWVTFIADEAFAAAAGATGTVYITALPGEDNMIVQLAYGISNQTWGLGDDNFDLVFTDCMEVINGKGYPSNLCGPKPRQLVEQATFTMDDLITIVFDAKEGDDFMLGASYVDLCAKAYSGDQVYEICNHEDVAALNYMGDDVWEITFWPRSYFDIPEDQDIDFMEVTFTNDNGNLVVTNIDGSAFIIAPKCFD